MKNFELTILMPCLNESETLGICINKAKKWISKSGVSAEIVIADNGSTDGSIQIAESLGAKVIHVSEKGYGAALYQGCLSSNSKFIIMGDSDDSYDFSDLDSFLEKLREGFDLVMGNRFAGGIKEGAMPWKNRYVGNPALSGIGRVLFGLPVRDFHCGLRGFSKNAFLDMDLRTSGMEFASEMVIKASLLDMKIAEVPTTLSPDGRSRPPHLRPWRDGWRHLRFMFSLSPKWLLIYPSILVFTLGFIGFLIFQNGEIQFGPAILGFNSAILFSSLLILGYIGILGGISLRVVATREGILPTNKVINTFIKKPIFEFGTLLGLLLVFIGVLSGANAFESWASRDFGELPYGVISSDISTTFTAILLGGTTIVFSLIFGFLSLPLRQQTKLS